MSAERDVERSLLRAGVIFSLVASCRLHGIDPEQYFDEVMRALPESPLCAIACQRAK